MKYCLSYHIDSIFQSRKASEVTCLPPEKKWSRCSGMGTSCWNRHNVYEKWDICGKYMSCLGDTLQGSNLLGSLKSGLGVWLYRRQAVIRSRQHVACKVQNLYCNWDEAITWFETSSWHELAWAFERQFCSTNEEEKQSYSSVKP